MGRPLAFATNARFLLDRGRRKLGLERMEAHELPNPVPLPKAWETGGCAEPMLLFVGRLHPEKRPWVVLELARRFPGVRFVVAGPASADARVAGFLAGRARPSNVELAGLVEGREKDRLFRECWALLNTSIHEGLPMTFLEAFAYGKPVVSGVDPEDLATRFGYCAGVRLGSGLDEATLAAFSEQIARCLADERGRRDKGAAARRYVEEHHTFEAFERALEQLLAAEGLLGELATGRATAPPGVGTSAPSAGRRRPAPPGPSE